MRRTVDETGTDASLSCVRDIESLEESRPAIAAATTLGYCYWPYQADREHWFCKPSAAFRTHHLHMVPMSSPEWLRSIAFRDYLRAHPQVAAGQQDAGGGFPPVDFSRLRETSVPAGYYTLDRVDSGRQPTTATRR